MVCVNLSKNKLTAFLFLFPAVLVVLCLLLYPVFSSIFYSFTTKHLFKPVYKFVGIKNYIKILSDPMFYHSFYISIKWTVLSLFWQVLIGASAALALNHIQSVRGLFRTLLIIPWAFPTIVIALIWKWLLNGVYGFVPHFLIKIGFSASPIEFLTEPKLVFSVLVFINVWFGAPLIMVNVLSALQTVPQDQYEAAEIDGASALQSFIYITIPHIRLVVGLLVVLRTIWIFNGFDIIFLITGGGPADLTQTLPLYAYNYGWGLKQLGAASSVTVILLLFLLMVSLLYFKLLNTWEKEGQQ